MGNYSRGDIIQGRILRKYGNLYKNGQEFLIYTIHLYNLSCYIWIDYRPWNLNICILNNHNNNMRLSRWIFIIHAILFAYNKLLITSLFWTTSSIFKVSSFMASNYERQTQLTQWETIWQHFFVDFVKNGGSFENYRPLKSTQYKKLAQNALWFTY